MCFRADLDGSSNLGVRSLCPGFTDKGRGSQNKRN